MTLFLVTSQRCLFGAVPDSWLWIGLRRFSRKDGGEYRWDDNSMLSNDYLLHSVITDNARGACIRMIRRRAGNILVAATSDCGELSGVICQRRGEMWSELRIRSKLTKFAAFSSVTKAVQT